MTDEIFFATIPDLNARLRKREFTDVELVTSLPRTRRGVPIQDYQVYRLSGPIGPPLDPP